MITTRSEDSTHLMGHVPYQGLKLPALRTTQDCCSTSICAAAVGVLSMSQIWKAIWSQRRSMGFISGLLNGQSMTSTFWFPRKFLMVWAVSGWASWWTRTKLFWKVALAQDKRLCCSTCLYTCWFRVPSSTINSLLPPWRNPAYAMTDGPTLPSVPCIQTSMSCPLTAAPTMH